MNWLHSCSRVEELLSQRLDEPLALGDRIRLHLHLSMCTSCRNIEQQLDSLTALSARLFVTGFDWVGPSESGASARAIGAPPDRPT